MTFVGFESGILPAGAGWCKADAGHALTVLARSQGQSRSSVRAGSDAAGWHRAWRA